MVFNPVLGFTGYPVEEVEFSSSDMASPQVGLGCLPVFVGASCAIGYLCVSS